MKFKLFLGHDEDVECPCENDGAWKLYSFNSRHINYRDYHEFLVECQGRKSRYMKGANVGIQRKLNVGTAFLVSCYEHSGIMYSLKGEGMQCHWDTTGIAGILVWEHSPKEMGAKTYKDREQDARNFLEEYNHWVNGQCYYFTVEKMEKCEKCNHENGEVVDSCGGYIGYEYLKEILKSEHPELFADGVELEVTGDAAWIME
jgi:hypothetical protein